MDNPLVSILVLTYNQKEFVEEGLSSLTLQTYPNLEFILVDDASNDGTSDWLRASEFSRDERFTFVYNETNIGISASLNKALKLSSGKYICIFASDDVLQPQKVESQVAFFELQQEQTALVYSDASIINQEGQTTHPSFIEHIGRRKKAPSGDVFHELIKLNFIPTPAAMIRKNVLTELGGFNEQLPIEDYDLWLRIAELYDIQFLDDNLVLYREHDSNNIKKLKNWNLYKLMVFSLLKRKSAYLNLHINRCMYHLYQQSPEEAKSFYSTYSNKQNLYPSVRRLLEKNRGRRLAGLVVKVLSLIHP